MKKKLFITTQILGILMLLLTVIGVGVIIFDIESQFTYMSVTYMSAGDVLLNWRNYYSFLCQWNLGVYSFYICTLLAFCIVLFFASTSHSRMRRVMIIDMILCCIMTALGVFSFEPLGLNVSVMIAMISGIIILLSFIPFLRKNIAQLVSLIIPCVTLLIFAILQFIFNPGRMLMWMWICIPLTQAIFFFVFAKMFKPQHN